jgi:DNA-binding IclR family transcriptional regulator
MLAELSRAIALPKPTCYRLALLLESAGYLAKDPHTLRYSVGARFEDVALCALRHGGAGGARRRIMESMAQRLGSRVNFVVVRAGELTFVEWVDTTSALRIDLRPETRVPIHCSASGKLLMANAPEPVRDAYLRSAPFPALTSRTLTTARALEHEFERIRERGYSEDDQEYLGGVNCLAVPVRNEAGETVAALATMAPVATLPLAKARAHLPELRRAAEEIAAALGWKPAGDPPPARRKPAGHPRSIKRSSRKLPA